jgi:hypothetical protein
MSLSSWNSSHLHVIVVLKFPQPTCNCRSEIFPTYMLLSFWNSSHLHVIVVLKFFQPTCHCRSEILPTMSLSSWNSSHLHVIVVPPTVTSRRVSECRRYIYISHLLLQLYSVSGWFIKMPHTCSRKHFTVFATLRKATERLLVPSCWSALPSAPMGGILIEFDSSALFQNLSRRFKFH